MKIIIITIIIKHTANSNNYGNKNINNNNLLILDVKQLNKIIKLSCFYTLKALWDGQGKIKMHYGMSKVKKQLSGKRSIQNRFRDSTNSRHTHKDSAPSLGKLTWEDKKSGALKMLSKDYDNAC